MPDTINSASPIETLGKRDPEIDSIITHNKVTIGILTQCLTRLDERVCGTFECEDAEEFVRMAIHRLQRECRILEMRSNPVDQIYRDAKNTQSD